MCPVIYNEYVEIHHEHLETNYHITHDDYRELVSYVHFKPLQPTHYKWFKDHILVRPECDFPAQEQNIFLTESTLAQAYHHWYWKHEVETQREYRWLGQVAVKMPTDLFFYQELIYSQKHSRILEVGYGRGGGLYFIHTILRLLNRRGSLVGVDLNATPVEGFDKKSQPFLIHGDARDPETLKKVRSICAEYDLVILDLGGCDHLSLELLPMWAQLTAPNGVIVVEDVWADSDQRSVIQTIDTFLLKNRQFGIYLEANRHPFLKGIALQRAK